SGVRLQAFGVGPWGLGSVPGGGRGAMLIERWTGPPVDTHTYLVADEDSGEAWIIDAPLETAHLVLEHARGKGLRPRRLVLTHGHFDHILDVERYQEAGLPVAICGQERAILN